MFTPGQSTPALMPALKENPINFFTVSKFVETEKQRGKIEKMRNKTNGTAKSWERATLQGAVVWGPVYSTAFAGSAYLLAPAITEHATDFSELLKSSLMVFPFAGAFRGALMWRIRNGYNVFRGGMKKGA